MSKYLIYYGSALPKYANDDQYGAWYDIVNPFTAFDYYKKKGVSSLPGEFVNELKDYSEVRDTISNRPFVLRKAARKLKNTPFDTFQNKTISNYRGSGWQNIVSQSPTSPAEAYAIVASMYYMAGNIYQKSELLSIGDTFIKQSKRGSDSKNVNESLSIINKGIDKLNKDAKRTGAIPAWYNIFGILKSKIKGETAINSLNKYAKAMSSEDEIQFAMAMREARMEDESPLGSLIGSFSVVIGGIVLFFTAPYWMPVVGGALKAIPGIASRTASSVKGIASKGASAAGKGIKKIPGKISGKAKDMAVDTVKDVGTSLIETAKKAVEEFDVDKFSNNVNQVLQNLQKQGKPVSQKALMQSQEVQKMFQKFLENQNKDNKEATKQEMKKLLKQLLLELNS